MKIFFVIFSFFIFCYHCEGIEVECEYKDGSSCDDCLGYYCRVQNSQLVASEYDRDITGIKVKGQHQSGKSNSDVKGLFVGSIVCKFFPHGLTKFFNNLERISITSANLQQASKEDLREFGSKLKRLGLYNNLIEFIDADLFQYNQNLMFIYLHDNKIKHISDGTFASLKNLKTLQVSGNSCTSSDDNAYNDRSKVLKVIESVERKCKDWSGYAKYSPAEYSYRKFLSLEEQISSLVKLIEQQNSKHNEEISELKSIINGKCNLEPLSAKISNLHSDLGSKVENSCNLSPLSAKISNLGSKLEDNCNFSPLSEKISNLHSDLGSKVEEYCKEKDPGTSA